MNRNPIEDNPVTRVLVGLSVLVAMAIVGEAIGRGLLALKVPYAPWLGVAIGIGVVFVAFVTLYRRYDASYASA